MSVGASSRREAKQAAQTPSDTRPASIPRRSPSTAPMRRVTRAGRLAGGLSMWLKRGSAGHPALPGDFHSAAKRFLSAGVRRSARELGSVARSRCRSVSHWRSVFSLGAARRSASSHWPAARQLRNASAGCPANSKAAAAAAGSFSPSSSRASLRWSAGSKTWMPRAARNFLAVMRVSNAVTRSRLASVSPSLIWY